MKKNISLLIFSFAIVMLTTLALKPVYAADSGIWKGTTCAPDPGSSGPTQACTFCDGLVVIGNVVQFLFDISIPLAVGMTVYGAVMLMIAGGSEDRLRSGKGIITNALFGLLIAFTAWIIIRTILQVLSGNPSFPWNVIQCS